MKKILYYAFLLLLAAGMWSGCQKGNNYPGAQIVSVMPLMDLRLVYQGSDVKLDTKNMLGATSITGMVISDHSGTNMPAGLLVLQDKRRLNTYRGIAVNIGADAAKYTSGDSVTIRVEGGTLTRANGILQITGVNSGAITKVSSGNVVLGARATSSAILAKPDNYESTLVVVVKGGFNPVPAAGSTYKGDYFINDGFGDVTLHTEAGAAFAGTALPGSGNFTGIIFNTTAVDATTGVTIPQLRIRTLNDVRVLSATPSVAPFLITGFVADPISTDANYEYIQLLATRDINFADENFTVVTTNNAGASTPTGYPVNGWATGGLRTYKLELTSGTVTKGQYFYVGGTGKRIMGSQSTDISSARWIKSFNYSTTQSPNFSPSLTTFGAATSNLIGNSGNASGIAVFAGTNITATSVPFDVMFIQTGGMLYDAANNLGYRIGNTDYYDTREAVSFVDQPFYRQGTNTLSIIYPTVATATTGYFAQLGGLYNVALGKWVTVRALNNVPLTNASLLSDIEGDTATKLK